MINLPKKIIRMDDGMEFVLDEKLGTYHVHLGIPHLDEGDHFRHEYTYEGLMSCGGFKVSDGTEDIAAMKKKCHDEMTRSMKKHRGHGDYTDDY